MATKKAPRKSAPSKPSARAKSAAKASAPKKKGVAPAKKAAAKKPMPAKIAAKVRSPAPKPRTKSDPAPKAKVPVTAKIAAKPKARAKPAAVPGVRAAPKPAAKLPGKMPKKSGTPAARTRNILVPPPDVLEDLVARAKAAGATSAEALLMEQASLSVSYRLGKREDLTRAEGRDVGLRVFIGKQQAMVSSSDASSETLAALVERAMAMARTAPDDPYCGLADRDMLATKYLDLEVVDTAEPDAEELYARAAATEDAARAIAGVTNSDGAEAGWRRGVNYLYTSDGFSGSYASSGFGLSVSVVAGKDNTMETDHAFSRARFQSDLRSPEDVGTEAGQRAARRVNPRKIESERVPIVFDPRVANSMLGHLTGAISGPAIARGTSFLRKDMGKAVFAEGITIVDDPHRKRGLGSRPFDGEGVRTQRMNLVDKGVLKTWLMSTASARQLELRSTGHASRGINGPPGPSPSNLYMEAGKVTPAELMADIRSGIYVTDLIGFGINPVTGDYSRGAAGFRIENGELAYSISEFTIAGNLRDMFLALVPANDLEFRRGADAPTIRIDGMTVAGK